MVKRTPLSLFYGDACKMNSTERKKVRKTREGVAVSMADLDMSWGTGDHAEVKGDLPGTRACLTDRGEVVRGDKKIVVFDVSVGHPTAGEKKRTKKLKERKPK